MEGLKKITGEEEEILKAIERIGSTSTADVSVKTLIPPKRLKEELKRLKDNGLVVFREMPESSEKDFITLSYEGRELLRSLKSGKKVSSGKAAQLAGTSKELLRSLKSGKRG